MPKLGKKETTNAAYKTRQEEIETSNRFLDRKYINISQYKLSKKGVKITELHMRKQH